MKSSAFNRLKPLLRLPYLPIVLAPILLFSSSLFTGRVIFWGLPTLQFIPWRAFAWEGLQNGILPLWNPFNGLGAPLIANYQLAFFYAPGWLVYLAAALGGIPLMAWSHTLLVVLHLIWAGIGMTFFVRTLGLGVFAQTISGLAFALSGYLVARNSFYSMIWAAAWLPWILYAITEILARPQLKFSFKLLIFISMQLLAGHAQLTWYSLLLAGLWTIFFSWSHHNFQRCVRAVLLYLATVAAGVALSSIQLLPTAEFLLQSQRSSAVDYELGLTYSFWPWRLLTLLSPDFFGNPGSGSYFGYAAYWEDAAYIGLIPFILALSSLKTIFSKKAAESRTYRPILLFFGGIIIAGFVLALGKNLPVFPFLYKYVPTFGLFNAPARWMIWVVTALCVLAGYGAETWQAPVGKAIRRYKMMAVVTFAVALGAGLAWLVLQDVRLTFIQATAITGFWGLVFCLLTLRIPKPGEDGPRWIYLAAFLVAIDLVSAQFSLVPTVDAKLFAPAGEATPVAQGQRVYLSYTDEYTLKFQRFFRIDDFNPLENWSHLQSVLLPNINLLSKVAYVNNFDPLLPGRYAAMISYLDKLPLEQRIDYLKILNVGTTESIDPSISSGVQFQPVQARGRFQWAGCAIYALDENDSFNKLIANADSLVNGQAVIEGKGPDLKCDSASSATVTVVQDNSLQTTIKVSADRPGWLIMADTWYPGWEAQVDGNPSQILPADYLLRGIFLDQGQHKVIFSYRPMSFTIGAAVSISGWLVILLLTLGHKIRFNNRNRL
jgi:hypothetical protein